MQYVIFHRAGLPVPGDQKAAADALTAFGCFAAYLPQRSLLH